MAKGTVALTPSKVIWSMIGGLLAVIILSASSPAAQYVIDPARSAIVVQLFKAGVGSAFAHDHVVRAANYSGQIQLDPAAPTAAQITIEVDATTLAADEPEVRRKYHLPLDLSSANRREIQQTMESEAQLDVRRHAKIRFRSTRMVSVGEGEYTLTGDLELRGVTRPILLSVQATLDKDLLRAQASGRFLQSSFGYKPFSALLGAVQNKDEVLLQVDIVAIRQ